MTHVSYLAGLIAAISGLLIIDYRFRLAFWDSAKRTWRTVLSAMAVFVLWDFAGIAAGIFYHNNSDFSLPFTILPEFPIEEIFFLFLLCYVTLLLYTGANRLWPRT